MKRKIAVVCLIAILGLYLMSMSAGRPSNLGHSNGKLSSLPDSPNAVSTQTTDDDRKMAALKMNGSVDENMNRLVKIIAQLPRTAIVEQTNQYLHVEFTSLIFRFVDDVEFYLDQSAGLIHFRSASRVGHSDMGANRRRMESIIEQWNAQ